MCKYGSQHSVSTCGFSRAFSPNRSTLAPSFGNVLGKKLAIHPLGAGIVQIESRLAIARLQDEIAELNHQLLDEAEDIGRKWEAVLETIETYPVKPRRSDVRVELAALAWAPSWEIGYQATTGNLTHDRVIAWAAKIQG